METKALYHKEGDAPPVVAREWTIVAVLLLLASLSRWIYGVRYDEVYDDAFITFRYARNLVEGNGFVYNLHEQVAGASSPLFTYLAAGLQTLFGPTLLPVASRFLGVITLFVCAWLFYSSLGLTPPGRVLMMAAMLSYPRIFYSSLGGMEECFILMLMALSFVAVVRRSPALLGLSAGLLLVTKVDTVVWLVCLALAALLCRQPSMWRAVVIACGISLPWFVFSFHTFGSLLPHTILAKQIAYAHESMIHPIDVLYLAVPDGLRGTPAMVLLFASSCYAVLFGSLWVICRRKEWRYLVFPVYCLAYTCALVFSGTSLGLWVRWTVPLWGCLVICLAYLVHAISLQPGWSALLRPGWKILTTALLLYVVALVIPFVYPNRAALATQSHKDVASWIVAHSAPGESIMLEPIGLIGYRSGLYVHDFIGLVSPQVTEARMQAGKSNRWFTKYLEEHLPTYVMLRREELTDNEFMFGGYRDSIFTPAEKRWFESAYRPVIRTETGRTADWFVLFRRQPNAGDR